MPKTQIQEQIDFLLSTAIEKCDSLQDAQDLTQETLLSAFLYLEKGGFIENPRDLGYPCPETIAVFD